MRAQRVACKAIESRHRLAHIVVMAGGQTSFEIALASSHVGWRLDRALADRVPTLSRERLKVLTKSGALTRPDGNAVRDPAIKVKGDETFLLTVPAPAPA